jgi:hypothetical protein
MESKQSGSSSLKDLNKPYVSEQSQPSSTHTPSMNLPRRFTYNPQWAVIAACALFFGAIAALMVYKALHNERGLIINGIITLGPAGATVFYWVMAGLSALFVISAFLLIVRRAANPQVLEFTDEAVLLPYGFLQPRVSRIPYAEIKRVWEVKVSGQTFLYLATGGQKFSIMASLLPDRDSYQTIKDFMSSRAVH